MLPRTGIEQGSLDDLSENFLWSWKCSGGGYINLCVGCGGGYINVCVGI